MPSLLHSSPFVRDQFGYHTTFLIVLVMDHDYNFFLLKNLCMQHYFDYFFLEFLHTKAINWMITVFWWLFFQKLILCKLNYIKLGLTVSSFKVHISDYVSLVQKMCWSFWFSAKKKTYLEHGGLDNVVGEHVSVIIMKVLKN